MEYFKRIKDIFQNNIRVYCVYKDNKLISSSFNIIYKDTITYLYSGSNKEYNNMYPGYHLVFQTALASKKEGLLYFDLWGVGEQEKWKGFSDFKINLAPSIKNYLGSFDLPLKKSHYFIFNLLSKR
jgi:lipid II:glycine glycyltransferase (peptidoglycan interpeptide bridge formation enzyme)